MFGKRKQENQRLVTENIQLQQSLQHLQSQLNFLWQFGAEDVWAAGQAVIHARQQADIEQESLKQQIETAKSELEKLREDIQHETKRREFLTEHEYDFDTINRYRAQEATLKDRLSTMRAKAKIQEAGLTDYEHPAEDSIALQVELTELRKKISAMTRGYSAVTAPDDVTIPATKAQRTKFAKDFARITLRAFNAEVENIIRSATATNYDSGLTKIFKAAETLERLGQSASIRVSPAYIKLRARELKLAVDHLAQKALEKELDRERRAELREQAKVERELESERRRLRKEKQHYLNVIKVVEKAGDEEELSKLQEQIIQIEKSINEVDERSANVRAGYVYVISNIGSFGDGVVKIGMTRRLEPMERVKELGDASVPFNFDVHALFFSEDAVEVEAELHRRFAQKRVNRINLRREFFYATPAEVRDELQNIAGNLLEFREEPEAEQFRLSQEEDFNGNEVYETARRGMLSDMDDEDFDDVLDEGDV